VRLAAQHRLQTLMNEMISQDIRPLSYEELDLAKLGENIRKARRNLKLSQEDLADRCGLHRTYVSDIERGARNVSFGSLLKLARGLVTTISELTRAVDLEVDSRTNETSSKMSPKVYNHSATSTKLRT
jgi:ribosome-binding protein aMBF1 (putative translation factor)